MKRYDIKDPEKILKRVVAITVNFNQQNSRRKLVNLAKFFNSLIKKYPELVENNKTRKKITKIIEKDGD